MIEFLYENDDYSCCQDVGRRWMDLTATQVGSGYEFLNDFEVPWMQQERANNVRGEDLY